MVGTVRIFSVPPSALVEDAALAPLPRPLAALPAPRTPPEDMRDLLRVWTPAGAVALIALAVVTVDLIFELAVLTPAVALDTAVVFPARARPDIKHGEAYDLSQQKTIRGGRAWGAHLAMLCESWSAARRGGAAPLTPLGRQAWGLPKLGPEDQDKVETGGRCLEDYARRRIILAPLRTLIPAVASTFLRC